MIELTNIFNAYTSLTLQDVNIVLDPWIKDGIYQNSWCTDPSIEEDYKNAFLKAADFCLISHIHEDHFDMSAIEQLPNKCRILLPNLWPNPSVSRRKLPDREVILCEIGKRYYINSDTYVIFLGPMNAQGHLAGVKKPDASDNVVLDTAIFLSHKGQGLLFLCDNFPWDPSVLPKDTLSAVKNCDLLAVPFNSFADDYPICFDNYTEVKKLEISTRRNFQRVKALAGFCELIKPKNITPHSSDFFIKGPRALQFDRCHPDDFKSREKFSRVLSEACNQNVIPLSSNQTLQIFRNEVNIIGEYKETDFGDVCKKLYSKTPNISAKNVLLDTIEGLIKLSAKHMFNKMSQLGMSSPWAFQIQLVDHNDTVYTVDMKDETVTMGETNKEYLRCVISSGHLSELLKFNTHWDNERISYNLSWVRSIDEYEPNLSKGLNFFHIPQSIVKKA